MTLKRYQAIVAAVLATGTLAYLAVDRGWTWHQHEARAGCRFCIDDCIEDSGGTKTEEQCFKTCQRRGEC